MSNIKAGDLVMVVRPTPCCGNTGGMGTVYRAAEVSAVESYCDWCGKDWSGVVVWHEDDSGCDVSRLIRIDPPALPESVETEREVTA